MKVFLSYRREDNKYFVDRVYDRLVARFGDAAVFRDVDSIPLGSDFRQILQAAISQCEALCVAMGEKWLTITDKDSRNRLWDPDDFVRFEIETALRREVPVIPLLAERVSLPRPDELPEILHPLAFRQAIVVRPDPDFAHDIDRLLRAIGQGHRPPCLSGRTW